MTSKTKEFTQRSVVLTSLTFHHSIRMYAVLDRLTVSFNLYDVLRKNENRPRLPNQGWVCFIFHLICLAKIFFVEHFYVNFVTMLCSIPNRSLTSSPPKKRRRVNIRRKKTLNGYTDLTSLFTDP